MDRKPLCEAMYALPGQVVVSRRKSLVAPLGALVFGLLLLAASARFGASLSVDWRSAAVFVGALSAVAGLSLAAARLFGGARVPVYGGGRLRYEELGFAAADRAEVAACVARGDLGRLLALKRAQVPSVAVALYRTADDRFAAMQAFEYAELEYRPLTAPKIVGA